MVSWNKNGGYSVGTVYICRSYRRISVGCNKLQRHSMYLVISLISGPILLSIICWSEKQLLDPLLILVQKIYRTHYVMALMCHQPDSVSLTYNGETLISRTTYVHCPHNITAIFIIAERSFDKWIPYIANYSRQKSFADGQACIYTYIMNLCHGA